MQALHKVETFAMSLMLWALFIVVGLQFFTRYVLNDSLGWTEEVARLMLIILTYLGAVVCARNRNHIQVDLIYESLGERAQRWFRLIVDLISAVFFAFLAWTAAGFALTTRLKMSSIEMPKSIIYWICAVSLLLMALHYLLHFISDLRSTEMPQSDSETS